MNTLSPNQIVLFVKRFRFQGGSLRSFRIGNRTPSLSSATVLAVVLDTESNQRVRLRLRFEGVDEFRFQRRPGAALTRLKEVRFGWFNGLIYLNLDAYADDIVPALHDFRASDAFVAGRTLAWEIVPRKIKPNS